MGAYQRVGPPPGQLDLFPYLGAVTDHIREQALDDRRILLQQADGIVAGEAEETTYLASGVIVIHVQGDVFTRRAAANGAAAELLC